MMRLLLVFGTRPETIKLFPVLREARGRTGVEVKVCVTGQHREMLDTFLSLFQIEPDYDLNVMAPSQTLSYVAASVLSALDRVLMDERPDAVLVQGDTTSAMAAALASFHRNIPVGHVEAGLRTYDLLRPFPEEMNRQVISRIATWHFAPTTWARDNLLREGISRDRVFVTGNTVIDALQWVRVTLLPKRNNRFPWIDPDKRLILVTGHRRESFGEGLMSVCLALRDIVTMRSDVQVVYPVHLNPNVQGPVRQVLGNRDLGERVLLIEPVDYLDFVALLDRAYLVVTDSGGVQEEAPSFGKPVLCTRETTERPEGVEAGVVKLVGTNRELIVETVTRLLDDRVAYAQMAHVTNPYGDGHAAERILDVLTAQ